MNEETFLDVFPLCWDIIIDECIQNGNDATYFNSKISKILDATDINFDMLENRLAYTYKYGCYNIIFFEKCVLKFINDCSEFEEIFPQKKLKICSFSNGPGFDIVGFLCALCKSNKSIKSFPKLNAVHTFDSWVTLYKALINKACENINLKFANFIQIKPEHVKLFQGDILLSTLPVKAKKCIRGSNVLLMDKVFFSSKPSVNKCASSLKKLFLLLEQGTLVFFIGSKKDMNNFFRRPFLSNYVKTIYGPQTVVLENIMINENCSSTIDQKPLASGHAEFVVWQKRNATDVKALIKDFKENKNSKCKKTRGVSLSENSVSEFLHRADNSNYSSDSESKLSHTASESSKLSYVLTGELTNSSCSNDFDSRNHGMKSEIASISSTLSQNSISSIEEVISLLDKADLSYENNNVAYKTETYQQNQFHIDNTPDLINENGKKVYHESLVNVIPVIDHSENSTCLNIPNLITNGQLQNLGNSVQECQDSLNLNCIMSSTTNGELTSDTQCMSDENDKKFYDESLVIADSKDSTSISCNISNSMNNRKLQVLENTVKECKDKYVVSSATNGELHSDTQCISDGSISESVSIVTRESTIVDPYDEMNKYFEHSLNTQNDSNVTFIESTSAYENSCANAFSQDDNIVNTRTGNIHSNTQCVSDGNTSESVSIVTRESTIVNPHDEMNKYFEHSLNTQNDSKVTFTESTSAYENSCANAFSQDDNIVDTKTGNIQSINENSNIIEASSLHSLVQKCENLVTALVKFTISLKCDIECSKTNLKLNEHCCNQIYKHCRHYCCCCIKTVHTCCCRKM